MRHSLAYYIQCFDRLNCAKHPVLGEAPHKPVLLLALIELFAKQQLNGTAIPISYDLERQFEITWYEYVKTPHTINLAQPFYHMQSEPFWQLIQSASCDDEVFLNKNKMKNLRHLKANVDGASIDQALSLHFQNADEREEMKLFLIDRYFHKTQPLPEQTKRVTMDKYPFKPDVMQFTANAFIYAQAA